MAGSTIGGETKGLVVGVGGLVEICGMTGRAIRRRTLVSIGVAGNAFHRGMCSGQGEHGQVVVEDIGRVAGRMAGQAGRIVIHISGHADMLVIGLRIGMAIGTRHLRIIGRVGMAVRTLAPFAVVGAAVNGEILSVMIKGGGIPIGFHMTACAIGGELCSLVIGIGRLIIVVDMAAETGGRRIVVIAVVAGRAVVGNCCMSPLQYVKIVMVGHRSRHPFRGRGMAGSTIGGEPQGLVVGIHRLGKIRRMA